MVIIGKVMTIISMISKNYFLYYYPSLPIITVSVILIIINIIALHIVVD